MFGKRIIIIDNESDILEFISYNLKKEGFSTECHSNPLTGLQAIIFSQPDLVITDWLMPEFDGLELCRRMKQDPRTYNIPLVMITCKNDEIDIVSALEVGVDDYMVKPIKIKELMARIKKILRHTFEISTEGFINSINQNSQKIEINGLLIDKLNCEVHLRNKKIELTFSEYKILELLAEKPGRVYTRGQILQYGFGSDYYVTERTVDVKVVALRRKLGKHEDLIKTVRSVGYKLNIAKNPIQTIAS